MLVTCSFMSKTFIIIIPQNSSTNGASITTIFCIFDGTCLENWNRSHMSQSHLLAQIHFYA